MSTIKVQLKDKNNNDLMPVTSLAYVSATYAGGITFNSSTNTMSTANIPMANVKNLTTSLGAKQATVVPGFRTEITGATIGQKRYFNIETLISGGTVTLSAGCAYRILANTAAGVTVYAETTSGGSAITTSQFGLEGHATIIMTNSSYLHLGSNVVMGQPLITDAANNCTLRFHDGHCIIDVEDHDAAHTVTVATGTGTGSLYYFCSAANTNNGDFPQYISFSDALDGTACTFNGVTVNGEKHLLGNGTDKTILTGNFTPSTSTHITHVAFSGTTALTGGTVYATDCTVVAGGTATFSSPMCAYETLVVNGTLKVPGSLVPGNGVVISGNGGTINLGGTNVTIGANATATASGCTFSGGSNTQGGCFNVFAANANLVLSGVTVTGCTGTYGGVFRGSKTENVSAYNCTFSGNSGASGGVGFCGGSYYFEGCTFSGNSATTASFMYAIVNANFIYSNCTIDGQIFNGGAAVSHTFAGSCSLPGLVITRSAGAGGSAEVGAILDMTGNTNAIPISLASGFTFPPGGATVYPSAGSASAMVIDAMKVPAIGNNGVVNLSGGSVSLSAGVSAYASNCTFTGGYIAFSINALNECPLQLDNCVVSGNSGSSFAGGIVVSRTVTVHSPIRLYDTVITNNGNNGAGGCVFLNCDNVVLSGTTVTNNSASLGGVFGDIELQQSASATVVDCTLGKVGVLQSSVLTLAGSSIIDTIGYRANLPGSVFISSSAIIDLTGNTNATPINPGSAVTFASGGATVYPFAGSSHAGFVDNLTVAQIASNNVLVAGGTITLTGNASASNVTLTGGTVGSAGGLVGILAGGYRLRLTSCLISGNTTYNNGNGGAAFLRSASAALICSGCTATNNSGYAGGFARADLTGTIELYDCLISGNTCNQYGLGGAIEVSNKGNLIMSNSVVSGNVRSTTVTPDDLHVAGASGAVASATLLGGNTVGYIGVSAYGSVFVNGSNKIDSVTGTSGSILLSSGAILDLTGNTNSVPISPGGVITFAPGGATVYPSAGSSYAYMLDNIALSSGAYLTSTGINLVLTHVSIAARQSGAVRAPVIVGGSAQFGGAFEAQAQSTYLNIDGGTISGCYAPQGGGICLGSNAVVDVTSCTISGCTAGYGAAAAMRSTSATLNLSSCIFSNNTGADDICIFGGTVNLKGGCTVGFIRDRTNSTGRGVVTLAGRNKVYGITNYGSAVFSAAVIISSGAILDLTGATNAVAVSTGSGVSFGAGVKVINYLGTTVSLNNGAAGTCKAINRDGTVVA